MRMIVDGLDARDLTSQIRVHRGGLLTAATGKQQRGQQESGSNYHVEQFYPVEAGIILVS
jgi:hypothetical protein